MTSEDDLSADDVVVTDPKSRDTFVGGPTSTTPKMAKMAVLNVNLAEDVTAGVASSVDLAEVVTVGVASSADLDKYVTAGVASLADLAGDVTAGVASLGDLAEVVTIGVAPSADPDGDVTAGVTSMEEYKERDAVLSAVVLPMVLLVLMAAHGDLVDPRPCRTYALLGPLNILRRRFSRPFAGTWVQPAVSHRIRTSPV